MYKGRNEFFIHLNSLLADVYSVQDGFLVIFFLLFVKKEKTRHALCQKFIRS